jgi:hypothetical protein
MVMIYVGLIYTLNHDNTASIHTILIKPIVDQNDELKYVLGMFIDHSHEVVTRHENAATDKLEMMKAITNTTHFYEHLVDILPDRLLDG